MKRFMRILSGVLFFAGVILGAGGAEAMNPLCIGAGIVCVALCVWLANRLDGEGEDGGEG